MDTASFLKIILRAGRDLIRPEILFHAIWPPVVSLLFWCVIAWMTWQRATAWVIMQLPAWAWLDWAGPVLAHIAVFLAFLPLFYATTLLLLGAFALPRMMSLIAMRDYPDVTPRGSIAAAFWGGMLNSVVAGAIFIAGWLITLPLLLIPGAVLVLPVAWATWLNQRSFCFDALAEHAQPEERKLLVRRERGSFYLGGLVGALAAYVPLLNLLAPSFTATLFAHLCLDRLRALRQEQGINFASPVLRQPVVNETKA